MQAEDLMECDHIRRRFTGATLYGQYTPGQKWYYLSRQRPDEALIMKMFDSEEYVRAKRKCTGNQLKGEYIADVVDLGCPHSSFKHPHARVEASPRRSIEVRALVFTYANTE